LHCFSAEAKVKLQERRVNTLVEQSCLASSSGEFRTVRVWIHVYVYGEISKNQCIV